MRIQKKNKPSAFSLVETLVVIAVIGIIVAIALPNIGNKVNAEETKKKKEIESAVHKALFEDGVSFVGLASAPQMSGNRNDVIQVLREVSLGAWIDISETKPRGNGPEWDPSKKVFRLWKVELSDEEIEDFSWEGYISDGLIFFKEKE